MSTRFVSRGVEIWCVYFDLLDVYACGVVDVVDVLSDGLVACLWFGYYLLRLRRSCELLRLLPRLLLLCLERRAHRVWRRSTRLASPEPLT